MSDLNKEMQKQMEGVIEKHQLEMEKGIILKPGVET